MPSISVKADIAAASQKLTRIQRKQIPYAASRALNETAYKTMVHAKAVAKRRLHRPRGDTLKGIRYTKTTKRDLRSSVYIDDGKTHSYTKGGRTMFSGKNVMGWLYPNVHGGERHVKRSEHLLRQAGVLPKNKFLTPGPKWTDGYGNIKPGVTERVLSQMQAFKTAGFDANTTAKSKKRAAYIRNAKFFVIKNVGIFTRRGRKGIEPVFFFADKPNYRIRYPFKRIVNSHVRRIFPKLMRKHLIEALKTAK